MNKMKTLVLMLCFILSGALCYASGSAGTGNEKGEDTPIEIMRKSNGNSSDKGQSINSYLDGHCLMVSFSENLGEVAVAVETVSGSNVQCLSMLTPSGMQFYIPNAGDYIVTFTLPNGDEYYGEFTVTD